MASKKPPGLELPHSRSSSQNTGSFQELLRETRQPLDLSHIQLEDKDNKIYIEDLNELLDHADKIKSFEDNKIKTFFTKYPHSIFYDEDDIYFLEKATNENEREQRKQLMNTQIQEGLFEFIKEITNKNITEIEQSSELKKQLTSFNQMHQGHPIELKSEGLSLTDIQRILDKNDPTNHLLNIYQRKEDWRYKYEMNSKLYHVTQLCIAFFNMMLTNQQLTINQLKRFIEVSTISDDPNILFLKYISQHLVRTINLFKTLQNIHTINFDTSVYTSNPHIILENIIQQSLPVLSYANINIQKIKNNLNDIREVKGYDIVETIKQIVPNTFKIIKEPTIMNDSFHFHGVQPRSNIIKKFFGINTSFPYVECLFQRMTPVSFSFKIKTHYSDIVELQFMYDINIPPNPSIHINVIKNPISFKVYDHYPQVIQTYYCFTLLTNKTFMTELYKQLNSRINTQPKRSLFPQVKRQSNVLEKIYKVNVGGIREKDLKEAIRMDEKYNTPKGLLFEFQNMIKQIESTNLDEAFYKRYADLYILNPQDINKTPFIYCVVKNNQECIESQLVYIPPINGGKKMIKKSRKQKNNGTL